MGPDEQFYDNSVVRMGAGLKETLGKKTHKLGGGGVSSEKILALEKLIVSH